MTTIENRSAIMPIGLSPGDELFMIPLLVSDPDQGETRNHAGDERDSQIDEYAPGDLAERDFRLYPLYSEDRRQNSYKNESANGEKQYLEDGIEGDKPGAVLTISPGQVVPGDHRGDAAGQAYHDEPQHVFGVPAQKHDGKSRHEDGTRHPVLEQGQQQDFVVAEDTADFFASEPGHGRVHHEDQPDRNRADCGSTLRSVPETGHAGEDEAQCRSREHGDNNPQCEKAVEKCKLSAEMLSCHQLIASIR